MKVTEEINNTVISAIIEAIQEKKGNEIITMDFAGIHNAICDYFVICDADSDRQVAAIAEGIEEKLEKEHNTKVWRKTGQENNIWILLDYFDVVVHIFQKQYRDFYQLEDLWADAKTQRIKEFAN